MNEKELNIIEKHLKKLKSGWYNVLERYADGTILIEHGASNRAYTKKLKIRLY